MFAPTDLLPTERRMLAALDRLTEGQTFLPEAEAQWRVCRTLQTLGLATSGVDALDDGFWLTTQGRAVAEACA
jgi:hypothetical protein